MEGGSKVSIHDEQEIVRLREQTEKLHSALRSNEQKLKEAMQLLSTACIVTNGDKHSLMWLQRRINLENRYYNYRD
jgi:hypothetical protein